MLFQKQPAANAPYPIGVPGMAWGAAERAEWLRAQQTRRSYAGEVLAPLEARLPAEGEVIRYGALNCAAAGWSVYLFVAVRSRVWRPDRPVVLVTAGVHGYETSGVQGALQFIEHEFARQADAVNLLVLPCISPWGLRDDQPLEPRRARL